MKLKRIFLGGVGLLLTVCLLSSCGALVFLRATPSVPCEHSYGEWTVIRDADCVNTGLKQQVCLKCKEVREDTIPPAEHTPVTDPALSPTCQQDGLTEGSHCAVCDTVITQQEAVPMPDYTASEINEQAIRYVGEIITYDRSGSALSLGTGILYSADGRVLTNYHVMEGAYSAKITINGVPHPVQRVLAYDKAIDLAVLDIRGTHSDYATLCDEEIAVGSKVYAIGSSKGMTNTFSQGIVTYYDRVVDGVRYVQHDASITNGNSGGPLINEFGEVVGVNTWGIADSQNLNFAVFVAEVKKLNFDEPLTMAEFYEDSYSAEDILLNWLLQHLDYEDEAVLRSDYFMEDTFYSVCYGPGTGLLFIDVLWSFDDGTEMYLMINLNDDPEEHVFYADYYQGNTTLHQSNGILIAPSFTETSPLIYTDSEGIDPDEAGLTELYQLGICDLLSWFRWYADSNSIGVDPADFGFTAFEG